MRRWPTSSRRLAMSGRLRECRSRYSLDRSMDRPVDRDAGVSASQERKWGLIGGLVGTVVGVGSAAVAVGLDGAPFYETGLYPSIFERHEILAMDLYLLAVLIAG